MYRAAMGVRNTGREVVMIRFKLHADAAATCGWLDGMSARGWRAVGFGGCFFHFEPCEPGEYTYQMDFTGRLGRLPAEYRSLMEDMELGVVGAWGPWVLLEARSQDEVLPIYTDSESKEARARRAYTFFRGVALAMFLTCMLVAVVSVPETGPLPLAATAAIVASGALALLFLLQCRRLMFQIDGLRAERGAAPKTWRRVPVLMLVGMAVAQASTLARSLPALRTGICTTGLAIWAVGVAQYLAAWRERE